MRRPTGNVKNINKSKQKGESNKILTKGEEDNHNNSSHAYEECDECDVNELITNHHCKKVCNAKCVDERICKFRKS